MRENDAFDVLSDFDDVFIFGVDGINADGMEKDAVFLSDGFGDAAGDFVEVGDGEGVFYFDVDGAEVFVGAVVGEDEVKSTFDIGVFHDGAFDSFREGAFGSGADDVIDGFFDEVDAGFDDVEGDEDTDVGFEVEVPNHVNDGGGEDGDGKEAVVESIGAASDEGIGVDFFADFFDVEAEDEFDGDTSDEDDEGGGGVVGGFGGDEFFDRLNEGSDTGVEDDGGDDERGDVFDTTVAEGVITVGSFASEFSTYNGNDARKSVA